MVLARDKGRALETGAGRVGVGSWAGAAAVAVAAVAATLGAGISVGVTGAAPSIDAAFNSLFFFPDPLLQYQVEI